MALARVRAYRGYLTLQQLDQRLLEGRLPAAIFYNLIVTASKPYRSEWSVGTIRRRMERMAAQMPLFRRGRPLKRWRYVGVFGEEFMICAASGPGGAGPTDVLGGARARQQATIAERTRMLPRRGALDLTPGRLRIRDSRGPGCDLALEEE